MAGSAAGALVAEEWDIADLAGSGLFVLAVARLLRAFKDRS
ncbi:hypothetical protein NG726_38130 [Pseudomonas sp. MOB-449]|nr:hypothetical protein [Pseudomonas sp. MOB-449]